MAPGDGDVSMARDLHSKPWKSENLNQVLQGLEVSGSVYFLKTLRRPQPNLKFGYCNQLILPMCFIKEHAEKFREWVILRTFSSSKAWRVRACVYNKPSGSFEVRFVGGWREFAAENRLSEGDSLIFVLKLDARSEFEVYIFRGTSVSAANSQVPARQWSIWKRMSGCKVEKDAKFSGRYTLRSVGDGNMREGGELYTGKKRKVDEAPRSGVESEVFTGSECKGFASRHRANSLPSFCKPIKSCDGRLTRQQNLGASFVDEEYDGQNVVGSSSEDDKCSEPNELAFQHGANFFPHFEKRITATDLKHHAIEVPASFVKTHGMKLNQAEVKVQGIHHESPVRIVRLSWKEQFEAATRLFLRAGWSNFMKENGLHKGQELRFTLTAASFFVVREV
ncbi:hypothetical protein KC19_4G044100 [Ceratodon purpureus]|uniref:TF-B3 domain-containing protein n=1 Tax=Ceratodon purpureus TaxID=3225 RepID=A0A8T0I6L1_CERPU|nr:hypothetical protein KC19_4G044100 [Ceratodon purpureus]